MSSTDGRREGVEAEIICKENIYFLNFNFSKYFHCLQPALQNNQKILTGAQSRNILPDMAK